MVRRSRADQRKDPRKQPGSSGPKFVGQWGLAMAHNAGVEPRLGVAKKPRDFEDTSDSIKMISSCKAGSYPVSSFTSSKTLSLLKKIQAAKSDGSKAAAAVAVGPEPNLAPSHSPKITEVLKNMQSESHGGPILEPENHGGPLLQPEAHGGPRLQQENHGDAARAGPLAQAAHALAPARAPVASCKAPLFSALACAPSCKAIVVSAPARASFARVYRPVAITHNGERVVILPIPPSWR